MRSNIKRYERVGNDYIAFNAAGKPVGVVVMFEKIIRPPEGLRRSTRLYGAQNYIARER